jgi:signal transduction histidine kinase
LIFILAGYLALTGGAVAWMLINNAAHTSSIRVEAQKELLISDLAAAGQVEAEHAGLSVEEMSAMDDGDSMSETGLLEAGPGDVPADDSDLLAAIASFDETATSLAALLSDSERQDLEDVTTAHNDFVASIAVLDTRILIGQEAMSFYHNNTRLHEAALRSGLQELQLESSKRLQSAIDEASSTQTQLTSALPLLLLAGILATVYLVRMQATRRQIVTLEHLVEAKGEFVATVSHELRTPLTAVVGFADLLRNPDTNLSASDKAELMATIADQSNEVSAIVEDLLVAARTDVGELTVVQVPVDLRAQTAQILETLDQGQSIAVLGDAPKAIGDPARVRQILRNLITNAKRYGGDHISIEMGTLSDSFASIVIKDDGDPISEEDQKRIFEPYERAQDQPGQAGSIGIGLAVSQRLARLMGGDLTYQYQAGHSMFQLSLPLAVPADPEDQRLATATTS